MNEIQELEAKLHELKIKRRRISRELDDLDTQIIGSYLALDKAKEKERLQIVQKQSQERYF